MFIANKELHINGISYQKGKEILQENVTRRMLDLKLVKRIKIIEDKVIQKIEKPKKKERKKKIEEPKEELLIDDSSDVKVFDSDDNLDDNDFI